MKAEHLAVLGFVAVLGIIHLPVTPLYVRTATYVAAIGPSVAASG